MASPNTEAVKRVDAAQRSCSDEMASQMLDEALQPFARDLVCVYETQTVGDALQTLATWGVLGAPVVKGQPPWLSKRHARNDIADWPFDEAGADNPRMADVLGFVSVGAIVTALVAETRAIADTDVDGIHDACADLFAAQVSEVFDLDALGRDWEVLGATSDDSTRAWTVRGACPTAKRSLREVIGDGFFTTRRKRSEMRQSSAHRIAVWTHAPPSAQFVTLSVEEAQAVTIDEPATEHSGGIAGLEPLPESDLEGAAKLINVFTQSDALAHIHRIGTGIGCSPASKAALAPFLALRLSDLRDAGVWDMLPPVSCSADDTLLSALRTMTTVGLSALAVVDSAGALIGNVSASDVRCLLPQDAVRVLTASVAALLEARGALRYHTFSGLAAKDINKDDIVRRYRCASSALRRAASTARGTGRLVVGALPQPLVRPEDTLEGWAGVGETAVGTVDARDAIQHRGSGVVAVREDSTVGAVTALMVTKGLHRVYVVAPGDTPAGVITQTDILRIAVGM